MKKDEYTNLRNFLNKIKDTLSQYGYEHSTSFKRTCNFKNLSQWAEAQFNLLQLYKKCEKETL